MNRGKASGSGGLADGNLWVSGAVGAAGGAVIAYLGLPSYFSGEISMVALGYGIFMLAGFGFGLFCLAVGLNRPTIADMRTIDLIHLLATGGCLGVGLAALGKLSGLDHATGRPDQSSYSDVATPSETLYDECLSSPFSYRRSAAFQENLSRAWRVERGSA